jgi:hypothetical protein
MTAVGEIRYTLLGDGPSDRVLLHHLSWLLRQHSRQAVQATWADLSRLRNQPKGLSARMAQAVALYPCDLLFVHRDAEREPHAARVAEIHKHLNTIAVPVVCVVPVRMSEAWLLFDERAIRLAAGNPTGRAPLALPRLAELENEANPKQVLREQFITASGLSGRRQKRFDTAAAVQRLGECIADFSPLRALPAFAALEREIVDVLKAHGWQ